MNTTKEFVTEQSIQFLNQFLNNALNNFLNTFTEKCKQLFYILNLKIMMIEQNLISSGFETIMALSTFVQIILFALLVVYMSKMMFSLSLIFVIISILIGQKIHFILIVLLSQYREECIEMAKYGMEKLRIVYEKCRRIYWQWTQQTCDY